MKKSLLATAAAAALIASSGWALAQGAANEHPAPNAGASEMHKSGPDMKKQGSDMSERKGSAGTTGQGSEMNDNTKGGTNAATPEKPQMRSQGKPNHRQSEMNPEHRPNAAEHRTNERSNRTRAQGEEHRGPNAAQERRGPSATTGQGAAASAPVQLTNEQKTDIRRSVMEARGAPRVERNNIHFNIGVGTVVPRTIHVVTVPETLIRIHPAWRGYRYFVVGDEIIIVQPDTMRIVAVLPV